MAKDALIRAIVEFKNPITGPGVGVGAGTGAGAGSDMDFDSDAAAQHVFSEAPRSVDLFSNLLTALYQTPLRGLPENLREAKALIVNQKLEHLKSMIAEAIEGDVADICEEDIKTILTALETPEVLTAPETPEILTINILGRDIEIASLAKIKDSLLAINTGPDILEIKKDSPLIIGSAPSFKEGIITYTDIEGEEQVIEATLNESGGYISNGRIYTIEDGSIKTMSTNLDDFLQIIEAIEPESLIALDSQPSKTVKKPIAELMLSKEPHDLSQLAKRFNEITPDHLRNLLRLFDNKGNSILHYLMEDPSINNPECRKFINNIITTLKSLPQAVAMSYLDLVNDQGKRFYEVRTNGRSLENDKRFFDTEIKPIFSATHRIADLDEVDTHTATIHESANQSFQELAKRAATIWEVPLNLSDRRADTLHAPGAEDQFRAKITEELTELQAKLTSLSIADEESIKKIVESLQIRTSITEEITQEIKLFRFKVKSALDILPKILDGQSYNYGYAITPDIIDSSLLTMREIFALSYFATKDEAQKGILKADGTFSPNEFYNNGDGSLVASNRSLVALLDGIFDGLRGYLTTANFYVPTIDHKNRCPGGAVNSLCQALAPVHSMMEIVVITPQIVAPQLFSIVNRLLAEESGPKINGTKEDHALYLHVWKNSEIVPEPLKALFQSWADNTRPSATCPDEIKAIFDEARKYLPTISMSAVIESLSSSITMSEGLKKSIADIAIPNLRDCSVEWWNRAIATNTLPNFIMVKGQGYRTCWDILAEKPEEEFDAIIMAKREAVSGSAIKFTQLDACKRIIRSLIKVVPDILYRAWVVDHNLEIVKLLIENGVDLNQTFHDGMTPLYFAIKANYPEIVKLLIENGVDRNQTFSNGKTPLSRAIGGHRYEIVKLLIENGADPNQTLGDGDDTPLCWAIKGNHLEIVKLLIENGVDPNQLSPEGYTPLSTAILGHHLEIAKWLIEQGVDPNQPSLEGWTPLCQAIVGKHLELARLLIYRGANQKNLNSDGREFYRKVEREIKKDFDDLKDCLEALIEAREEIYHVEGETDDATKMGVLSDKIEKYNEEIDVLIEKLKFNKKLGEVFQEKKYRDALDDNHILQLNNIDERIMKGTAGPRSFVDRLLCRRAENPSGRVI